MRGTSPSSWSLTLIADAVCCRSSLSPLAVAVSRRSSSGTGTETETGTGWIGPASCILHPARAGVECPAFAIERQRLKEHRTKIGIVFLIVFIDLVGFGIVIPILPLYAEEYGPSPVVFGLLMASFSVMQFIFAPILGRLSDRVGRRPVLLVSLIGSAVGYVLFGIAGSIAMLFASRIIDGISGGNISTAHAVIADITGPEDRAKGMGLIGAAFGAGIPTRFQAS